MFETFCCSPLFGIVLTLGAYAAGVKIYSRFRFAILHPVLTSSAVIIVFILISGINIEEYQKGGSIISFMLGPATVSLAVPLYRRISVLKKHAVIILVSISVGTVVSIVSVILLSKAFGLPEELILSLSPKSITTPIAVEVAGKIGGMPPITALAVITTGIIGAIIGPGLLRLLRITEPAAKGLAMGTAAHAIGTSRALEMGETEGAVSSLSIGLAGIITVITVPFIITLLL